MRVVFMGTPDFAVAALKAVADAGHEVIAAFTQPDKPVGRKQILTPSDVKVYALEHGIPVYQPATLRTDEAQDCIRALKPEVIVVAAYGKILPKAVLEIPPYGCINVHGSLLPRYRGAAPIQWAVINGEAETGITIMQMNEGLDTGDILLQRAIPIGIDDTAESMFDKLSALGGEMTVEALEKLPTGEMIPIRQEEALSNYAPMLSKEISLIDWSKSALEVHNLVRGLYSWPIAHTFLNGKKLKIYRTALCEKDGVPGEVIAAAPLTVACGKGSVIIEELQLEGKKRMDAKTFLVGHPMAVGTVLGELS